MSERQKIVGRQVLFPEQTPRNNEVISDVDLRQWLTESSSTCQCLRISQTGGEIRPKR